MSEASHVFWKEQGSVLICGDALQSLRSMAADSVHCVVTSPPYLGQRVYGTVPRVWGETKSCNHQWEAPPGRMGGSQRELCRLCGAWSGELGAEKVHDCAGWAQGKSCSVCYVCHLRAIFAEIHRVLREDGTLWLNLGDSYNGSGGGGGDYKKGGLKEGQPAGPGRSLPGLKPKDLVGIPWRVALALQADGWYLRSDVIWHKSNPMPESVKDRPTRSHEHLFLLTRSKRYYFDSDALREPQALSSLARIQRGRSKEHKYAGKEASQSIMKTLSLALHPKGRNRRDVWTLPTAGYRGAHFAVFPEALVKPCLLAGTSQHGCCPRCKTPWRRVVKDSRALQEGQAYINNPAMSDVDWEPGCKCGVRNTVPCIVLDPFAGAGTTGAVALSLRQRFTGIELNPDYCRLSAKRLTGLSHPEQSESAHNLQGSKARAP